MKPHNSSGLRFWCLCSLVPCLFISGMAGCASVSVTEHLPWSASKNKDKDLQVVEIMALWQPGEGRDTRGLPCRGFAGQIFFFKQGSRTPSKVDGDVKVYVFDDQGNEQEQAKPIHIYEFQGPAWDVYNSKSNIGEAYQVFIPYTRPGVHRAICSLRIKYTGKNSEMVLSEPADVILKGSTEKIPSASVVSNQRELKPSTLPNQQTRVATINRAGKVQPHQSDAPASELSTSESALAESSLPPYQKNTQVSHTMKKAQVQYESDLAEQAVYSIHQPAAGQSPSAALIEQASWQQEQPASQKPHLLHDDAAPQTLIPAQTLKNIPSAGHPLSDQLPQSRLNTRPITEQVADQISGQTARQNADSLSIQLQTAQPQPDHHPLSIETKSSRSPKSFMRVETIILD